MLLPLLGACAVVGPFQGPEWEPVRGLISQDCSCRDPRCCGNLLVLCLFLIWQVRHYWHQFTRTRLRGRNVLRVPLQKRAMPSMRCETFFRLAPEFFSPGDFRGLDAYVQQWVQRQRWKYRRSLLESWTQYLLSSQHLFQNPSSGIHTSPEPIFCTTFFSSTCPLSQDSSQEAWHVPWCLRGSQTHSALDTCQRIERLLVPSQEKLVPLEHILSTKTCPHPMTFVISLPNLPSAQRLQLCSREFLPDPSHQQMGVPTWTSWNSPQETWASLSETQTVGRENSGETQAPGWANQRESRGGHAWEIQASGGQLPIDFGMEHCAEAKDLEFRNQPRVISETDGEILIPGRENWMAIENQAQIEELGKKIQRKPGGKNPPESQVPMGENQEQLRCKIDAETQTPGWAYQQKSGGGDVLEIQPFERKNKKELREEDEGEIRAHGLGKQGQTRDENAEEAQTPECRKQNQTGGDTGAEIEAEEGRNKDQVGNEDAVHTPASGRENLEDAKQENRIETQELGWGKQDCSRNENITEIQALVGQKQGQGGDENATETQAPEGEKQKLLRHAVQVRQGNQDLGRGEKAVQPWISKWKKFREIREEDWVVIQTPWWGNQNPVVTEIDREFKISCWGNQNQIGGGPRAEIQTPEENDQRKNGDEDGIDTLVLEAENQGLLRNEVDEETHPAGKKNEEQFGDENGADIQALGKRNPREFKGENGTATQEIGGENQGRLENEFHGNICIPQRKNQEHIKGKDGANTQIPGARNLGELTSKSDGETPSAGWKKVEHVGGESSAEILLQGRRNLREAEGEGGTETWAGGERSQSQPGSDMDRKTHLSQWENQKQMEGQDGTEIQAPKKRKQRESEGEDDVKIQRHERENQGQLENVIGRSHSLRMGSWVQTEGEDIVENQASEKKNQRGVGIENGRKIHKPREKNQRLLRSKVHRRTCSSECKVHRRTRSLGCKRHRRTCSPEWKNQEEIRGGNAAEIQIQGKRNPRRTTGGDGTKMQAPVEDDQGQSRREIDGEVQKQGQGNQNKGGDAAAVPAAGIWNVEGQRKHRAESRRGNKSHIREKDAMGASHQGDCSSGERPIGRKCSQAQPTTLIGSRYEPLGQEQAAAVNSGAEAPCPEMKTRPHLGQVFLPAAGEGEHLTRQGIAPAREYKARVRPASQQAQIGSRRKSQKHKGVDPGKIHGVTQQPQNPQSLAAPFGKPSACPSLLCDQALQAATALTGVPTVLTIPPKWPVLKKSKRLLLESLMRRRIAHLKWGLPRRILESYLLFSVFGSCSLPLAGMRLPELGKSQELQKQQEKHSEAQGSMPGFKSPERFQRVLPSDGKNSELPAQARALKRCGPHRSEPIGISIPPETPRRIGPPGGTREPQVQEEAPKAKLPAPKNPRPAAESVSWCSPERVSEPSSENSWGRKVTRLGVSQKAERAPRVVITSSSRAGHDPWKNNTPWEGSQFLRCKSQQPTRWRRESLEPAEDRGARQQPPSCSTDSSTFKGSLHSKTAKLSMTLLSKMSWYPQLAKPRNSVPSLSRVSNPYAWEDSIGVHTASERDHQPPRHRSVGVALPRTKSPQGQSPCGAPQNPSAPKKFGFMKHLRCLLFRCGLKK